MRHVRSASILAASLFLVTLLQTVPDQAEAGRPVFAANVQVTFDDFEQYPCDMEVGPDGTIFILYQSNQRSFKWCAYMVSSSDGGNNWTSPVRVDDRVFKDTSEANYRINPRMAIGQEGTIYVVWEDYRNFKGDVPESRPVEIRFSKSIDGGATFSESRKIDPWKAEKIWHSYQPDIAVNADGRLVTVWQDWNQSGGYRNIFFSFSTDDGATWSTSKVLNTDTLSRNHYHPRIAIHGSDVYVTWHDTRNASLGPKPFLVVSNDGGVTFGTEINITDDFEEKSERIDAEMAIDESGNLFIVWTDKRAGFPELWMTRSEDQGATLAKNLRVVKTEMRSADFSPTIAAIRNGLISVSWYREYYDYEGDPIEREIFYTNSSNGGRVWNEVLRVDDTDRYGKDLTNQEYPMVAYTDEGRTVVCFADGRNYLPIEVSRQIFFARHSVSLTGKNVLPTLSLGAFSGPFEFDRTIGNATTEFEFRITYTDYDNDMPSPGYPRVKLFTQDKVDFTEWMPMVKVNESRNFYIEGIEYRANATLPVEGTYYWRVETVEERDPTVITSPFLPGPLIDTTPPTVVMLGPAEMEWKNVDTLNCTARVTDTGGSHVNTRTIRVQYSTSGPEVFERAIMAKGTIPIDNDTCEAYSSVKLGQGKDNYVRFEAYDMVGNGPTISDHINLWIDSMPPYFTEMYPKTADIQIYADVNCSIVWLDHIPGGSSERSIGLDPDTIMYKFRTTTQGYSEWLYPEKVVRTGTDDDIRYGAWVNLRFSDKGVYNYIVWRAADLKGNLKETPEKEGRINVDIPENYAPVFVGGAFPNLVASETPHLWWEDAYDEEGDTLYYKVMVLDQADLYFFTTDIEVGQRTFFDIRDEKRLSPGHWTLRVNVTDRRGGWDVLLHEFVVSDFGTPPPKDVPPVGPFYLRTTNETITWAPSPSGADRNVTYLVRIGTQRYLRDVIDWTDIGQIPSMNLTELELEKGIYSFQVMAFADENYSRVSEGMLKISDYSLKLERPEKHLAYRGSGASKAKPIEIVLINYGTYDDNATMYIDGELVDKEWAYFGDTQSMSSTRRVPTSKLLTTPDRETFTITVYPPSSAEKKEYSLWVWAVSEDNGTVVQRQEIKVTISDAPVDSKGSDIGQGIYNLVTDLLPFLKGLPQWLVIVLFFLLIIGIVAGIAGLGIYIARRGQKRRTEDPYEKHKQIYRDLYGVEPPADYKGEPKSDEGFDVDKLFDEPKPPAAQGTAPAPPIQAAPVPEPPMASSPPAPPKPPEEEVDWEK